MIHVLRWHDLCRRPHAFAVHPSTFNLNHSYGFEFSRFINHFRPFSRSLPSFFVPQVSFQSVRSDLHASPPNFEFSLAEGIRILLLFKLIHRWVNTKRRTCHCHLSLSKPGRFTQQRRILGLIKYACATS